MTVFTGHWRQLLAGVSGATSLLASGAWFTWPAPLLPRLLAQDSPVPMNLEELSWMVSFVEIGDMLIPFPATFFADRYGRKFCLLLSAPLFFIGFSLTVYIKTFPSLCAGRFILGLAMGIPYTITPLYLGEIASSDARGTVTSLFHFFFGLGSLFPYCIGPYVSYDSLSYYTILLTILFVVCFAWQPESPYYYAMKNKREDAAHALKRLRDSVTEESIQRELEDIQLEVKRSTEEKSSWKDIFETEADRRAILMIIIVGAVSILGGQTVILTYTTETFSNLPNNIIAPEFVTIGVGTISFLGSIISLLISDKLGRRFLLLTSGTGCMISVLLATVYFYLVSNTQMDLSSLSWIAPIAVMVYNLFVGAGLNTVCVTYTSELFPTKTRGVAAGICAVNITACSLLSLKLYATFTALFGIYFNYLCFTIVSFIGLILFYFLMPETKGKSFLEIREILEKL